MDERSIKLRKEVIDAVVNSSRRGHIPSAFSILEVLRVLYDDILKYDPKNPKLNTRDRFILSKGHGCLALYALLADKGFFPKEELNRFCLPDGLLGGHPEHKIPGVELSTGSLGHGLPVGVGMAISGKFEKSSHRIFVVIGDGESCEGSIWEAAMLASKHKLDNLAVIVDYNKQLTYGTTHEVQELEPFADKWKSFGWAVKEADGHDIKELKAVFSSLPIEKNKPSVIIANTVKGKGIRAIEKNFGWHHKSRLSDEEIKLLKEGI
ncbi:transketolase [Candidatus Woesearchaeota archaeon]|nr:transketolase [Candidatus Woesearchaeota archaeon]